MYCQNDSFYPDIIRLVASDTGVPAAILVLFLVLVAVVIFLLVLLILWRLYSWTAGRKEGKRTSLLKESSDMEGLREDGSPPPYSPSIFSTGEVLDGVSSNNVTASVTINGKTLVKHRTKNLSWNSDMWEVDECEEALDIESLNLENSPQTSHQVVRETISQELPSLHETSIYYSCDYLSVRPAPNAISDCQAVGNHFLLPKRSCGGSSGSSFCSSFSQSSSIYQDLEFCKNQSPVFKLTLDDQKSPLDLPEKKTDQLCDNQALGRDKLHFNFELK